MPRIAAVLVAASLVSPLHAAAGDPRPAAPATASATPAAPANERIVKGLRFLLPQGYAVEERFEREPGEERELIFVATHELVEVHAEVENGRVDCKTEFVGGTERAGPPIGGRATCEIEGAGPPSMGAQAGPRQAAKVEVQFADRHLSVLVFAPDAAQALALARAFAATGAETR
jgi:hypothetical protein